MADPTVPNNLEPPLRFVTIDDKTPKCFLSVRERPSGDLIIDARSRQFFRESGLPIGAAATDPRHGIPVKENRYSVHMSPESQTGVNTIKLTHVLANGETKTAVQYTAAIKRDRAFAFVFANRCGDLKDPCYNMKKYDGSSIMIPPWQSRFSLLYAVFVGPTDLPFCAPESDDMCMAHFRLQEFSVVLLYTWLNVPADDTGMTTSVSGIPARGEVASLTPEDCVEWFDAVRRMQREEFIATLRASPAHASIMPVVEASRFFKLGWMGTPQWREHCQNLVERGLIPPPPEGFEWQEWK